MKVKVIKEFVDKHTNKLHSLGSVFECSNERLKEIEGAGTFVVPAFVSNNKAEKVEE